ncbi:MAG: PQQ-binding-like beta-propeller repeat protein, partial [Polyangiaceae bacterium]|nr:PQQ-binding-like beta-propeller repeat protein [Polyangiaceae bacterium]
SSAACGASTSQGAAGAAGAEVTQVTVIAIPAPGQARTPETPEETPVISTAGGSWSLFHGDIARTGFSGAPSIKNPVIQWRARVGIQGWLGSPVIAGGLVLIPSQGEKHNAPDAKDGLHALELRTGRSVWHAHFKNDANGAAVASDRAVATSDDGNIYAIAIQSGKILWSQRGDGKMYSSPLVLGDRVIAGDAGGNLRAFGLADGAALWSVKLSGEIRGGASADENSIYAVSTGGEAVAVTREGSEVWRRTVTRPGFGNGAPVAISAYAAPVVTGSALIVPFARDTYYDSPALVALDKKTGRPKWTGKALAGEDWGNIRSTPALTEQGILVYAEPYSGDVVGVDSRDGSTRFRRTVGPCFFPQWASPAATSELVYVPRFDGALYAVEASTGRVMWQLYLGEERKAGPNLPGTHRAQRSCEWEVPSGSPIFSPPAVADDGMLIVGTGEGFVFGIADGSAR